jgi:hypothetical protein
MINRMDKKIMTSDQFWGIPWPIVVVAAIALGVGLPILSFLNLIPHNTFQEILGTVCAFLVGKTFARRSDMISPSVSAAFIAFGAWLLVMVARHPVPHRIYEIGGTFVAFFLGYASARRSRNRN